MIAAEQPEPTTLLEDAVSLYWFNAASSTVMRLAK